MTDEDQAEAVIDGLADIVIRCECGKAHGWKDVLYRTSSDQSWRIDCRCGKKSGRYVTWRHSKRRGWYVAKRSLLAWRQREKQLLARIAELEELYDANHG